MGTGREGCHMDISKRNAMQIVNEISGNLILQVKEARIALDKTMAMRIMVA